MIHEPVQTAANNKAKACEQENLKSDLTREKKEHPQFLRSHFLLKFVQKPILGK